MLGIFKSKKEKVCDAIAECIMFQLSLVLKEKETIFNEDEDDDVQKKIFFNIYLSEMVEFFIQLRVNENFKSTDNSEEKYILDKIDSSHWLLFCNTKALISYLEDEDNDRYPGFSIDALWSTATSAAINDSSALMRGRNALNLYEFLTGKELVEH
jgi:hypothetical protein